MGPDLLSLLCITGLIAGSTGRFIGCYKENSPTARLMSGLHKNFKTSLTPEKCISHCQSKGFNYAGLQYGYECFCSNERPAFKYFAESAQCSTKCEGDQSKKCGGPWRLSVYDIQSKEINYVQDNYLGCYADLGKNNRALQGSATLENNLMTPEFCTGYCYSHGYRYAGTQYRKQCFCGDEIKGEKVKEGDCNQDCVGDSRFRCGGGWRNSIYHTSISDMSEEGMFLGCFKDSGSSRLLSGYRIDLPETNSPRRCMNICLQLGFLFSGVQYGNECYCGNKRPPPDGMASEKDCLKQCPNSQLKACGGGWRLAVYTTALLQKPSGNEGTPSLVISQPTRQPTEPQTILPSDFNSVNDKRTCVQSQTQLDGKTICKEDIIFQEEFNSWNPIWKHEIFMPDGPDYEFVVFDDNKDNVFLEDGKLIIAPSVFNDDFVKRGHLRLEKCTRRAFTDECERHGRGFSILPPIRSARISTKDSFSFKFGKVVITAKLPRGDWIVPEIWLEPRDRIYGRDYQSGRIRIAFSFGNHDLVSNGVDISSRQLEQGLLIGTAEDKVRGLKVLRNHKQSKGWNEDFHNFTLTWTPDTISFQVDNEKEHNLFPSNSGKLYQLLGFDKDNAEEWEKGSSIAPFDQQFYISLGVSVGGMKEFSDGSFTGQHHAKPWKNMAVKGLLDFWNDRVSWFRTWNNTDYRLEIADITVYAV